MLDLLLIPACAILDRLRGDSRGFGGVGEAALMGLCLWILLGYDPLAQEALLFSLLFSLGFSPGWGSFIGPILYDKSPTLCDKEWWQNNYLLRRPWLSSVVRGFMLGFPCMGLLLMGFQVWPVIIATTLAFPLSLCISKNYCSNNPWSIKGTYIAGKEDGTKAKWDKAELARGLLIGLITFLIAQLASL